MKDTEETGWKQGGMDARRFRVMRFNYKTRRVLQRGVVEARHPLPLSSFSSVIYYALTALSLAYHHLFDFPRKPRKYAWKRRGSKFIYPFLIINFTTIERKDREINNFTYRYIKALHTAELIRGRSVHVSPSRRWPFTDFPSKGGFNWPFERMSIG